MLVLCRSLGGNQNADKHRMVPPFNLANMETTEKEKRIQRFIIENKKFLPQSSIYSLKDQLLKLTDEQLEQIEWVKFKDPTILLIISIFLGGFGVDRFILGDTFKGVLKLILTFFFVGVIWWLIDLFKITDKTMEYNYNKLMETLSYV